MDIKLKSSKVKYFITISIAMILITFSAVMYSTYPIIKEKSKKYERNVFEQPGFIYSISYINYGLYYNMLNNKDNSKAPSDLLLEIYKNNTLRQNTTQGYSKNSSTSQHNSDSYIDDKEESRENYVISEFNERVYNYRNMIEGEYRNLQYYVFDKANNSVLDRNEGNLEFLSKEDIDNTAGLEALNRIYDFYIVIDYNENGKMQVKRVYGADKSYVATGLENSVYKNIYNLDIDSSLGKAMPVKNMLYIYAVPKELKYTDTIVELKNTNERNAFLGVTRDYLAIAFFFIVLVGIIIPYKLAKETVGFRLLSKVPIEISAALVFIVIVFTSSSDNYSIFERSLEGTLVKNTNVDFNDLFRNVLTYGINIIYWFIVFGIILTATIIIKHIFKTSVKAYILENSLIYRMLRSVWSSNKKIYRFVKDVDLKDKSTKNISMLLGLNFIIVSVISCLWFIGIFAAIIYTAVAFVIIKKHYNKISDNYNKLFEATNKIAEGNLDVNIDEDLGIFNAFKTELQSIQKGFKKAVNEEVKSQRMKTELITNVSHDLKTPLTSIITYVDLLKDEKLPEEKRREYLDTLDRKSQRLKDLIEDLFEVSKATSGNINLNIVDVEVVSLIKQTLLELNDKIKKSRLTIKTNFPEEKVILPLDSQRMYRVFENLIINITKYTMQGTRVYINVLQNAEEIVISLKNIAAEEIHYNVDDILERFVRGDEARNTEGSGLGLAIAKSFVELQGGTLEVKVDGDLFKVIVTFHRRSN